MDKADYVTKQMSRKPVAPKFSIKRKIMMLISAITVIFLIIYAIVFYLFLFPSLRNQEDMFARKVVLQVRGALQNSLKDLISLNTDWSNWDAMYKAIDNWTPEFQKEALPDDVFQSLHIDFVGVYDENHHPIVSRIKVDTPDGPEVIDGSIDPNIRKIILHLKVHHINGIFPSKRGPIFISANPIHKSDESGPNNGFLVMGRWINQSIVDHIGEIVREKLVITGAAHYNFGGEETRDIIVSRTSTKLNVVFPVKDYYHRNIFALRVELERSLFQVLYKSTFISMAVLLLAFLGLVGTTSIGFERIVVDRITRTAEEMSRAGMGKLQLQTIPEEGNDEITILQRNFNNLVCRIEHEKQIQKQMESEIKEIEKLATAGRVTGNILHEINNPIRVIKNCLFAIEKNPDGREEILALLKMEVRQLGMIANQLLDFTRGEKIVQLRKLDLREVLKETVWAIETAFPEENYRIEVDKINAAVWVSGDLTRLKQVFFNIMKNGLEAMAFSGKLGVEIIMEKEWCEVRIVDEGSGISEEELPRIFEPFYSEHKKSGVGLGLFVSYDMIKRHRGNIQVESKMGEGSCFRIRLPRVRETITDG